MKHKLRSLGIAVFMFASLSAFPSFVFNPENSCAISYEIPKVRELLFVAIAVSDIGEDDPYMINKFTSYYQEVRDHFQPYITTELNAKLSSVLKTQFDLVAMDASMYTLLSDNRIVLSNKTAPFSGGRKDHFKKLIPLLEDFAFQSNFEEFHSNHIGYYNSLIETLSKKSNSQRSLEWLNQEFTMDIENVFVIFSPLSYGRHSTNIKTSQADKTSRLFVSAFPDYITEMTDFEKEIYTTRMIFTELDHHFVNPISHKIKKDIQKYFHHRKIWIDDKIQRGYRHPLDLFNEYMTWSLFLIYMHEILEPKAYDLVQESIYNKMLERGFTQFKKFYVCALNSRLQNSNENIESLIPIIVNEWQTCQ